MLNTILTLATLSIQTAAPVTTAQVQPCVWPRVCASAPAPVAQIQPCVWPNICVQQSENVAAVEGEKPFTTCSLPNKCA